MQELNKAAISDSYKINISNITPYKGVYLVESSIGKKILKKTQLSSGRIQFIHGAKEHLHDNGFTNIDRYICTDDGSPFISIGNINYTLSELCEGRECNFDNKEDFINATRMLANLHKLSKGYIPNEKSALRDNLGKMPEYFKKRLDEIKKIKKIAQKGSSRFDYLLLQYIDYFYDLGEKTIKLILDSKYDELAEKTKLEGLFCHHDYTHSNIIFLNDRVSIINFEYCSFELKVYDVVNLLRRKMRKCNWDLEEAARTIEEYRKIEDISDDELWIIKIMLQFPQKFWRVINKYYNTKRSWSEKIYITKLDEVINEIPYCSSFIEKFNW